MARVKFDNSLKPFNVLALGAGKQSSYLLVKLLEGNFNYKLDAAIFSDTGNERKATYNFLETLKQYVWKRFKFEIIHLNNESIVISTLNQANKKNKWSPSPPFWLKDGGFLRRQCTLHLKIRPIRKIIRQLHESRPVNLLIGISQDEISRQSISDVKYITHRYPLCEQKIRLGTIQQEYNELDLPTPPSSSCIICPYHSNKYWHNLKKNEPQSFQFACDYDNQIRPLKSKTKPVFLHRSCIPLSNVDFSEQLSLFPEMIDECSGMCGL